MSTTTKQYARLEGRIKKGDLDGLLARWEFGRKLLAERGHNERFPNGRLEAIYEGVRSNTPVTAAAFKMECSRRMRFAEQYTTEAQVRAAFKEFGSWSAICARGLLSRNTVEALHGRPHEKVVRRAENKFAFVREYHTIMGRIRAHMKSKSITYRGLWLAAFEHGIEQEMQQVEREARLVTEADRGLLKFAGQTSRSE